MNVSLQLVDEVVSALAAELAPRLAAELVGSVPAGSETSEPWRLYDVEEAAAMFSRSVRWVRERVKRGELPHVRLDGGALAFDLADLQAFAQARRVSAEPGSVLAGRLQAAGDRAAGAGSGDAHRLSRLRVT